jgi:hypothetical protein
MGPVRHGALSLVLVASHLCTAQNPVAILRGTDPNGNPSSGTYKPSALSLFQLMESDPVPSEAMMTFMRTGDREAFRNTIMRAAQAEDLGAELLLAEQYIPEQCTFEPDQDAPHCGKSGSEPPQVVFRQNPLGIEASYEEAEHWLQKASAQGSGEASEVLAQLITRMRANGHGTSYTAADSDRLHALARSQGFDVEPISATCYKLMPGGRGIKLGQLPGLVVGEPPSRPFTDQELGALDKAGISGSLLYGGGSGNGDSILLMRPQGPTAHVRIILDHDPGSEVLLPIPAHRDVIYVQHGNEFLAFPGEGPDLPRFLSLQPVGTPASQISLSTQTMDGAHTGGFCTRFP